MQNAEESAGLAGPVLRGSHCIRTGPGVVWDTGWLLLVSSRNVLSPLQRATSGAQLCSMEYWALSLLCWPQSCVSLLR